MTSTTSPRPAPLTVRRIVEAACAIVERDGVDRLSMRRLGAELGVDPMAIYHHVANKRELLRLVTAQTLGSMVPPDPAAPWTERVRQWATHYWDLVATNRALTLAGLADPEVGAGGLPSTDSLVAAVAASGVPKGLVSPIAFIIVDAVHGSALAVGSTSRRDHTDTESLRAAFLVGLDTIVAGISAQRPTRRRQLRPG